MHGWIACFMLESLWNMADSSAHMVGIGATIERAHDLYNSPVYGRDLTLGISAGLSLDQYT